MICRRKTALYADLPFVFFILITGFLWFQGNHFHTVLDAQETINEPAGRLENFSRQSLIVVQGAGGSAKFQTVFLETCQQIEKAAQKSEADFAWIGKPGRDQKSADSENDKALLKLELEKRLNGQAQLWIILVGHGTYDRQNAKFNLRGPDVSAKELNEWLESSKRPVAIVNCASASAPFINELAGKGRVIVTSTKSGFELNYARFGIHFAKALTDPAADIDKDDQVSLLESFLYASRKVDEFYKSESRLSTEHALIDDNGDGKGTPLSFFRGVRVIKKSEDESIPDGPVANQIHLLQSEFEKLISIEKRNRRNALELKLEELRSRKEQVEEGEYFAALEKIAMELAVLYQAIEKEQAEKNPGNAPKEKSTVKPEETKPINAENDAAK